MLPTYSLSAGLLVWDTTGTDWNATVYKTEHLWTNPTLLLLSSLPSSSTISRSVWDKEKERRLSASEPPNHQKLNWEFGFEALRFLLGLEAAAQTCWGTEKWGKISWHLSKKKSFFGIKWTPLQYGLCYSVSPLKFSQWQAQKFSNCKLWVKHHRDQLYSLALKQSGFLMFWHIN